MEKVVIDESKFVGEIIYLALFDEYVLNYSHRWYVTDKGKIQILLEVGKQSIRKEKFKSKADALRFAEDNCIEIVHDGKIDHPLAHGLPDTRCIKPYGTIIR